MVLDEALEERIAEILEPLHDALAGPRPRGDPRRQPQAGGRARRARRCSSRSAPRPGSSCPADGARPTVVVLPGPPRELQRDVARRRGDRRVPRRGRRARRVPPGDAAAVRHPGVRDRRDAARSPRTPTAWRAWRSRPACAAARSRSSRATSPRAAPRYDALRGDRPRAPRRHAVLRRRPHGRRAGRRRCCSPRPDDRDRRVVHRRAAGGAADRAAPGSSDYVLGGLVVYSNAAKVALAGVDPALIERHGAVSTEVAEALADGARARLGRRHRRRHHRDRGPGRRHRGQARRARLLLASAGPDARLTRALHAPRRPRRRARPLDHRRAAPRPPAAERSPTTAVARERAAVRGARASGATSARRWPAFGRDGRRTSDRALRAVARGRAAPHARVPRATARSTRSTPRRAVVRDVAGSPAPRWRSAGALWLAPRRPHVLTVGAARPRRRARRAAGRRSSRRLADALPWQPERAALPRARDGRRGCAATARAARGRPARGAARRPVSAGAVVLFRSHLGGGGPSRYEALERAELAP